MKILIAEDNDDNYLVVKSNLKKLKHIELLWVKNGIEALKKLEEGFDVDLFLLDIQMPQMRGDELIIELKKQEKYKNIPIVVITASIFAEMKETYFDLGADEILEKPFSRSQLVEIVERYDTK